MTNYHCGNTFTEMSYQGSEAHKIVHDKFLLELDSIFVVPQPSVPKPKKISTMRTLIHRGYAWGCELYESRGVILSLQCREYGSLLTAREKSSFKYRNKEASISRFTIALHGRFPILEIV